MANVLDAMSFIGFSAPSRIEADSAELVRIAIRRAMRLKSRMSRAVRLPPMPFCSAVHSGR